MPQISLYIDEKTLKQVELAAKIENISISKYVVNKLRESMHTEWPRNYDLLFGSIDDDTFCAPPDMDYTQDAPREQI